MPKQKDTSRLKSSLLKFFSALTFYFLLRNRHHKSNKSKAIAKSPVITKKSQDYQKSWLPERLFAPVAAFLALVFTLTLAFATGFFVDQDPSYYSAATVPKIGCDPSVLGCNESATDDVTEHWVVEKGVPNWIEWLILFGAGSAVLVIVIGGGMLIVGGSNDDLKTRGKKTITLAVVGLLVAMFAYGIVKIIENIAFPGT
jgi:hypothetical protein